MSPSTTPLLLSVLLLLPAAMPEGLDATAYGGNICSGGISRPSKTPCHINCFRADPVCGADGVTYGCGCPDAACAGVRVVHRGPCQV